MKQFHSFLLILLIVSIVEDAFGDVNPACPNGVIVNPEECDSDDIVALNYGAGVIQEKAIQHKVCCVTDDVSTCGKRIPENQNEFPSAVAIMKSLSIKNIKYFLCGGTIINQEVVLTTAHCVEKYKMIELEIQAGLWDAPKTETYSEKKLQTRKLRKIIMHEEFDRDTHINNIALLILVQPFKLNKYIGIACPPTIEFAFDKNDCVALQTESIIENMLIYENDECESRLRQTKLGPDFVLHDSFLCAIGRNGEDTCEGDGGRGLYCLMEGTNDQYALAGLVSWGIDGCRNKFIPGVYVNISHFYDWITKKFTDHGVAIPYVDRSSK